MILALQRPDERKNLETLIRAYGESEALQELANLVLLVGTRDDVEDGAEGAAQGPPTDAASHRSLRSLRVGGLSEAAHLRRCAEIYRLAAARRGVFVNPALTEPFGLTLIEAAASGLPIVATNDGGPQEIIRICNNGVLIDPLDAEAMAESLFEVISDRDQWRRRVSLRHSWSGSPLFLEGARLAVREADRSLRRRRRKTTTVPRAHMALADRLLVCDIDNTLIGDREALAEFLDFLEKHRERIAFGVATGRVLERTLDVLEEWDIPVPDVLITAVGSEIHYSRPELVADLSWMRAIEHRWDADGVRECLAEVPGLRLQPARDQRDFKVSYLVDSVRLARDA